MCASQGPCSTETWGRGEGRQGYHRVTAFYLPPSPAAPPHTHTHFPVSCRNHISHNRAELPCQRRRVSPAAFVSLLFVTSPSLQSPKKSKKLSLYRWRVVSRANPPNYTHTHTHNQVRTFRSHSCGVKGFFYACFASDNFFFVSLFKTVLTTVYFFVSILPSFLFFLIFLIFFYSSSLSCHSPPQPDRHDLPMPS